MQKHKFYRFLASGLLALSLAACQSAPAAEHAADSGSEKTAETKQDADNLVRKTQYGEVKGTDQDGVEVYYGIPYGKEPEGDLRWKAPEDPDSWKEVRDAAQVQDMALQASTKTDEDGNLVPAAAGTTDSLNLDVYTTAEAQKKPVLVFIHGGNNQTGNAGEIPGNDMVKTDDLVYVSVNYRLGLLGFNNLPALLDDENNTGNFSMLDLAKALKWVQDNIENFGGDPDNVTVSGFSAGGRDVMAMLISPAFEGLFDKAIAYSGGMTIADAGQSVKKIAETIAPLAVEDNKAESEEEAAAWLMEDSEDVRDYLYSIEAERLAMLFPNAGIRMAKFPHLYNDGVVLPDGGFEKAEYVNDVPVIMVTGSEEFTMFGGFDPAIDDMKDPDAARAFIRKYDGDFYRIFNTQLSAQAMEEDGYKQNIYLCQFDYGDADSEYTIDGFGSFHGIFAPAISPSKNNYSEIHDFTQAGYADLAKDYNEYLASFVKNGKPVSASAGVVWTPFTKADPKTLVLDARGDKAVVTMEDVTTTNEEIIEEIEADPLDDDDKNIILTTIMNGRWFSSDLDEHFKTPGLW